MPRTRGEKIVALIAVAAIAVLVGVLVATLLRREPSRSVESANLPATSETVLATPQTTLPATTGGGGRRGPVWSGDFDQGNLAQWSSVDALPGRVRVVTHPRREGGWAGRFEVRPGDDVAHGQRAELVYRSDEQEGQEEWWAWSVYFPRDFIPGDWTVFTQWHDDPAEKFSPPVLFKVVGSSLYLIVRGGDPRSARPKRWTLAPLRRDHWYDFVFHVLWSTTDAGFVEAWVDGEEVVARTPTPTLYIGKTNYLKQGNYRYPSPDRSVLYQDAAREATSRRDLESG
jgi:hypothetical protein